MEDALLQQIQARMAQEGTEWLQNLLYTGKDKAAGRSGREGVRGTRARPVRRSRPPTRLSPSPPTARKRAQPAIVPVVTSTPAVTAPQLQVTAQVHASAEPTVAGLQSRLHSPGHVSCGQGHMQSRSPSPSVIPPSPRTCGGIPTGVRTVTGGPGANLVEELHDSM
ncbi:hypothetical protein XELAEV_18008745mg, partial [Xenopus laevis]